MLVVPCAIFSISAFGASSIMRRFIRHPSNIPLSVNALDSQPDIAKPTMVNVGKGGLCFSSDSAVARGKKVHITINVQKVSFEVEASVAWCHKYDDRFMVGVSFDNEEAEYSVRMVEQVCHIEQYRMDQMNEEGRELSSEEAAKEWVEKYAAQFPPH